MSVEMDAFQFRDDDASKERSLEKSINGEVSIQSQFMDFFDKGDSNISVSDTSASHSIVGGSASASSSFGETDTLPMSNQRANAVEADGQSDINVSEIFFRDDSDGIRFRNDSIEGNIDVSRQTVVVDSIEFASNETDEGFTATSVEGMSVREELDRSGADAVQEDADTTYSGHYIKLTTAGAGEIFADFAKFTLLEKKFERGTLVQALDKNKDPLMLLLQLGNDLMAYRPLKGSLKIEIPSSVGGRPVKYVHSSCLVGGSNPFKGIKALNLFGNFKAENLVNVNKDTLKESLKGIQELVLPEGLVALPAKLFYHCVALSTITIPSSVTAVSIDAFTGSCFRDIWFNGACPNGFRSNSGLSLGTKVHYHEEFAASLEL